MGAPGNRWSPCTVQVNRSLKECWSCNTAASRTTPQSATRPPFLAAVASSAAASCVAAHRNHGTVEACKLSLGVLGTSLIRVSAKVPVHAGTVYRRPWCPIGVSPAPEPPLGQPQATRYGRATSTTTKYGWYFVRVRFLCDGALPQHRSEKEHDGHAEADLQSLSMDTSCDNDRVLLSSGPPSC